MIKLDPDQWQRLKLILAEALEHDTAVTRAQFVERSCDGDTTLLTEARSLLVEAEELLQDPRDRLEACADAVKQTTRGKPDPHLGARLGAYEIVSEIGRGGMGAVYRARRADGEFEKNVAIKILRAGTHSEETLRRFRNERQILADLDHPNITRLLDAGTTSDGLPYFVMELVEGAPIDQYANTHELDLSARLKLFDKVCEVVELAHSRHVIHRDIKPSNILVREDGELKLLDFGIAKLAQQDGARVTIRAEQRFTPVYASPEQLAGDEVTVTSDIYSLGILLHDLVRDWLTKERDRGDRSDLPAIINRATARDPSARYQTVAEFRKAVAQCDTRDAVPASGPKKRIRLISWPLAAAAVLVAAVAIVFLVHSTNQPKDQRTTANKTEPATARVIRSIAVLPFHAVGSEAHDAMLGLGMADAVIGRLSNLRTASILPTSSIAQFEDKSIDSVATGKLLGVDAVVSGTVQRANNRVRLRVQLTQTAEGRVLLSETVDQSFTDIFAVQDAIADRIARLLTADLDARTEQQLRKHTTASTAAFDFYIAALREYNLRTKEHLGAAISLFKKAIECDPHYALAYALMADSYYLQYYYHFEPTGEVMPQARAAAEQALALDSSLAEAHLAMAMVEPEASAESLVRALQLNPNLAIAHLRYAWCLSARGQLNQAVFEMKRAQELDPLSPTTNTALGVLLIFAREYEEAYRYCAQAAELAPGNAIVEQNVGAAAAATGRVDEAVAALQRSAMLDPAHSDNYDAAALTVLTYAQRKEEAEPMLARLKPAIAAGKLDGYELTHLYIAMGDKNAALLALDKALEQDFTQPWQLLYDPLLDDLRGDPRFNEIIKRRCPKLAMVQTASK